ncbi:hypothetical protein [Mangrovicella endophytica]|uniref:hypothetical protein n=1 Tax=Mangrovicella endophytica TaxID=2066697 RepID=UPI000C9E660C|nr:hypothetical protein [Mangrovicella endophytica]
MDALRRDGRLFALVAAFLLLFQMALGGLTQGALAAEMLGQGSAICHEFGPQQVPAKRLGLKDCPCLSGSACCSAALAAAPAADAKPGHRSGSATPPCFAARVDPSDRRPLALFARAGRSPPRLA